ncbi:MAG: hypothetical protein ACRDXX_11310 [Stackebrandtia sp.]
MSEDKARLVRRERRDVSREACRRYAWKNPQTGEVVVECWTHGRPWPCERRRR